MALIEPLEPRTLFTVPAGFVDKTIISGLASPTAETVAPDGRLFVCEKGGTLRVVKNGQLLPAPFLSVPVDTAVERGLDGVALDPHFATNGYVYIYYTTADPAHPGATNDAVIHNRLSRFTVSASDPDVADHASEVVLLDNVPSPMGNHNGGSLVFGADGMLYLGVGEGGISTNAQDLSNLNGKVLRLNVANPANVIPADNPFVGQAGKRPEIWAYGFRNPFTSAIQPRTGRIFINDVGSHGSVAREEVDVLQKGGNFGWPNVEGIVNQKGYVDPLYAYKHTASGSAAISGGAFLQGNAFGRAYRGAYFFGDYVKGMIQYLNPTTGAAKLFATGLPAPVDLDQAPDGNLYYLSAGDGTIHEILPGDATPPTATLTSAPRLYHGHGRYYYFRVTYTDDTAVSAASLDNADLTITGPRGYSAAAGLFAVTLTGDGPSLLATYALRAPGGTWDATDDGVYTVTLNGRQIRDTTGNPARAKTLGGFSVKI